MNGPEIGLIILIAGLKKLKIKFNFKKQMMEYFGCVLKTFTNILNILVCVKYMKITNFHPLNLREIMDFSSLVLGLEGFMHLEFHKFVNV